MGGRVFKGTTPVNKQAVDTIVDSFNLLLANMNVKLYLIGSGYCMDADATTGDIDTLVNDMRIRNYFGVKTEKEARQQFRKFFQELGFETAQSGSTVHVKVVCGETAHQLDMMFVTFPDDIAVFHRHALPEGSPYKGFHKQMALFWMAKNNGLCWSAFQGLYTRDPQGHRDKLLTVHAEYVAQVLIGPDAVEADLGSFEAICAAMDPSIREKMLRDLQKDPSWIKYHEIH